MIKKAFTELSKATINNKRRIIISKDSEGGYNIAQQVTIDEGRRSFNIFMKGSIQIEEVAGLVNLRDALNYAIDLENEKE